MATFLWGGVVLSVCLFVVSCSEPGPGDRSTGSDGGPGLVLTIPEGALADPGVNLTIEEFALVPRGAVRAWELGPDGTEFGEPVVLEAEYGDFDLPPGVDAASLQLSVYVDERWVGLADSKNDLDKKVVRTRLTSASMGWCLTQRRSMGAGCFGRPTA